jgi:hypothetical protein
MAIKKRRRVTKEQREAEAELRYWKQFEHNGWRVIGWTYRESALFVKGQTSVDMTWKHLECLGIGPERK